MDYVTLFITVFTTVMNLYKKIHAWLYPIPQQMLIYDQETETIACRGYVNLSIMRVTIDHFMVQGDYTITVNGKELRNIKNRDQDGFSPDKQYFLCSNTNISSKPTVINIEDGLLGGSTTITISPFIEYNFKNLIDDMLSM